MPRGRSARSELRAGRWSRRRTRHLRPPRARSCAPARLISEDAIAQTMGLELERVRSERVRLQNLCTGVQVFAVDFAHQFGRAEVQLVEAAVDVNALRIEHRTHRAVGDDRSLSEAFSKILLHRLSPRASRRVWTRSHMRLRFYSLRKIRSRRDVGTKWRSPPRGGQVRGGVSSHAAKGCRLSGAAKLPIAVDIPYPLGPVRVPCVLGAGGGK